MIETGLLHGPKAHHTPAGDGHSLDQVALGVIAGVELFFERFHHCDKLVEFLFGEDDGFGEEAVAQVVARGAAFAFFGDGTSRLRTIAARRLDTTF